MSQAGKLHLRIVWNGSVVLGVGVRSTRPQAYRLLAGRLPENAIRLVPLLFSVCGKAQQAAAIVAISAAQGMATPQSATLERSVICEAMQEHLWRLLLDWPKQLGLPPAQQQFVRWHGELNAIVAGDGNAQNLRAELQRELLGVTDAAWDTPDSYAEMSKWWNAGQGLCAAVFAALDEKEKLLNFVGETQACDLMPQWSAPDILQRYTGCFDHKFAAMPQQGGKALETGALAHWHHLSLLQDTLRIRPSRLLARLIARLLDLLDSAEALAHENWTGRIQAVTAADGAGLAVVRTARGMLMHHIRIGAERVTEYLIVAPTEWNFHPQGALPGGLIGLKESDARRLMETVKHYVLSLDPCVEFEVEVAHA